MNRINRYIRKSVLTGIGMVLLVFVGLDLVLSLIDQQSELFGDYGFMDSAWLTLVTLPGRLDIQLPFVVLIGCLVGLGQLAVSSELTVMRASGVSTASIVWMACKPALLFTLLALMVGEFVAPDLDRYAQSRKTLLQWGSTGFMHEYGMWLRDGQQFANANAVQPDGVLYGLSVYRMSDQWRIDSALQARRASWQPGGYWLLEKVAITYFHGDSTSREWQPEMRWYSSITPDMLRILMLKPKQLSVRDLWFYADYLQAQGLDGSEYRLSFWGEALKILAIASLVLVAVSFIFGPLRSAPLGQRVFVGVIIGLVFNTLQSLLGPSSMVFGFSPFLAVMVPIAVTALLGVVLLVRAR
ncbi:MAG: LPS export ABC transporter permease LptG [Gammaproteobacteria bacterium]|nr:MAG: LPS export ABC transporter permease LptG [Gammaproteobacteria bacterium]